MSMFVKARSARTLSSIHFRRKPFTFETISGVTSTLYVFIILVLIAIFRK